MSRPTRRPAPHPAAEAAPSAPGPRTWQGIEYRPCPAGAEAARRLFRYAGAWAPAPDPAELAWEAEVDGRLVGAVLVERRGEHAFVHGPVVADVPAETEALDVADQLVAALLEAARAHSTRTLFARPQGLDRIWVRHGFVPLPEASLPDALRGRPGSGLHAWRRPGTYEVATPGTEKGRRPFRS